MQSNIERQYTELTRGKKEVNQITESIEKVSIEEPKATPLASKLRNLRKKLRQIDQLQEKLDSGEISELQESQKKKLAQRDEVIKSINELEQQST